MNKYPKKYAYNAQKSGHTYDGQPFKNIPRELYHTLKHPVKSECNRALNEYLQKVIFKSCSGVILKAKHATTYVCPFEK